MTFFSDAEASPTFEILSADMKKINYNAIPSKDTINDKLKTEENLINTEQKNEENHIIFSRRQSRLGDDTNRNRRISIKSIKSDSVCLQTDEAKDKEIDVFKAYDYPDSSAKQILEKLVSSLTFQTIINIFTVWCLFADDFKLIFVPRIPGDLIFNIINIICMTMFIIEIVVSSFCRKKYFLSFFFFMDLISTLIILFDLSWVEEAMTSSGSSINTKKKIPSASFKIMRIIRLVRLIRLLKLFKAYQEKKRQKTLSKILNIDMQLREAISKTDRRSTRQSIIEVDRSRAERLLEEKEKLILKETRIGKQILDRTVKLSIVMVLILVFFAPLFNSTFYYDQSKGYTIDLKMMSNMGNNQVDEATLETYYNSYISYYSASKYPLIFCQVPTLNATFVSLDTSQLRAQEKETYTVSVDYISSNFISTVDLRPGVRDSSIINIIRTVYVATVLLICVILFQKDLHRFVIEPLSRMILNINKIANDPLATKENFLKKKAEQKRTYETDLIEDAILKTGILLALGFGEAGAITITQNISTEGDLTATLPGVKTLAIFGFCDIRNFTDTTEILQEEVMVFVNSIAEIVHGLVAKYGGSANKNIGDAFLMVWKFPKSEIDLQQDSLILKKGRKVKNTCDFALISFLKIICAINKMPRFLKYRSHPGLNARIPNYQIKMGFGMHLGWAIEGTIGSEFKIDASYLSPNVNMAARLEAATKQYKSLFLISHDFMEYTSKLARKYCREIDRVTVKGSMRPIGLFTVDMDLAGITISEPPPIDKRASLIERQSVMEKLANGDEKINDLFERDKDLIYALRNCKGEFKETFDQGFQKYVSGEWEQAQSLLEKCLELRESDGPSKVILAVMEEKNFRSPKEWPGYRVLTEK